MKRLYLTVEGQTEQAFAVDVLQPHLAAFNVMVVKPRLTGLHPRRKGKIPEGGLLSTFKHSLGDVRRWLQEDKSSDVRFSTMIDLYSLPGDFPGYDEAMSSTDPHSQAEELEKSLAVELNDHRFIPYLQVHEFEALVLSAPEKLGDWFEGVNREVQHLVAECNEYDSPELINYGQHSHPKARLKKYVADYHQNIHGPLITKDIGLTHIRESCQHFNNWLTTLEDLDTRK